LTGKTAGTVLHPSVVATAGGIVAATITFKCTARANVVIFFEVHVNQRKTASAENAVARIL
jgi:shikimate kinase